MARSIISAIRWCSWGAILMSDARCPKRIVILLSPRWYHIISLMPPLSALRVIRYVYAPLRCWYAMKIETKREMMLTIAGGCSPCDDGVKRWRGWYCLLPSALQYARAKDDAASVTRAGIDWWKRLLYAWVKPWDRQHCYWCRDDYRYAAVIIILLMSAR